MNKTRRIVGNSILAIGLLLILAALTLVVHNVNEDRRAGTASLTVRNELASRINSGQAVSQTVDAGVYVQTGDDSQQLIGNEIFPVDPDLPAEFLPMDICLLDGDRYIGILDVDAYGLSLPVMENWDYDKLKTAPCRYSGSYKSGDLVICAHNYSNHFGPLRNAAIGTDVDFRSVDGTHYKYKVSKIETLESHEIEYMTDVLGDWDLTLFTCTPGGSHRTAIRCDKAE